MLTKSWKWKFILALTSVIGAVYVTLPNLWSEEKVSEFFADTRVNLGLDLQGGIHMLLGIDLDRAIMNEVDGLTQELKDLLEREVIAYENIERNYGKTEIELTVNSAASISRVEELLQNRINGPEPILEVIEVDDRTMHLAFSEAAVRKLEGQTINQALETLRNRIDEFGVSEPSIQAQGRDRIIVQLPGMDNPERAKAILGKTAQLEFMVVDSESLTPMQLQSLYEDIQAQNEDKDLSMDAINNELRDKLPKGTKLLLKETKDETLEEDQVLSAIPVLVKTDLKLTGDTLDHAQVSFDQNNFPQVELRFNPSGAEILDKISGENIGKQMAIILDDKVYSDPVLQSRISDGRPVITFGVGSRSQVFKEASDLAVVLRAGALPAPVEILETRTVGPSLGRDSIENGFQAILIGVSLVFFFMVLYYRWSGCLAVAAVTLNILFILACLGVAGGTLTLPGIAGILISVGMAVDANVIIYERIREELRLGKTVKVAVEEGYERAHVTILDSNVTTAITALVLIQFGTGPIKGFAITLLIGLVANYITALWFTRLAFEWAITKLQLKRLSV